MSKRFLFFTSFLIAAGITCFSWSLPFLWDNILIPSEMSHYFLLNQVTWYSLFHIPIEIDCGHPPFLSIYYSWFWTIPHLGQFPFLWMAFYALFRIAQLILKSKFYLILLMGLILVDTSILAQASQVGYEWPMIAFTLLAILHLLKKYSITSAETYPDHQPIQNAVERTFKSTASNNPPSNTNPYWSNALFYMLLLAIPLIQLRGISMVIGLFLVEFYCNSHNKTHAPTKSIWQILPPYVFSAVIITTWYFLHFYKTGYWLISPQSSWAIDATGLASFPQIIKNGLICCWRIVDYGHVIYYLMGLSAIYLAFKQNVKNKLTKNYFIIMLLVILPSLLIFLLLNKPICHRYFLIWHLLVPIGLLSCWRLIALKPLAKSLLYVVTIIVLLSGSFWIYPDKIAMGWDSTLAHLPYFQLREQAIQYLAQQQNKANNPIDPHLVAAHFPIFKAVESTNQPLFLKRSGYVCADIDTAKNYQYILYSNICTAFTDAELAELKHKTVIQKWEKGAIKIILYKR